MLAASLAQAATIRVPQDQPTVQAGLNAMHGGDTLQVSAGIFDGPTDLGVVPCGPTARCTIAGAGMDSTTVRGMQAHNDWSDLGNGLYRRVMEPSIDPIVTAAGNAAMRDSFDPGNLYQALAYLEANTGRLEHLPLGYAGDSVTPHEAGQWSYDPTAHTITVWPYTGHGIGDVLVPSVSRLASLVTSHGYWTVRDIGFEGSRAFVFDHQPTPAGALPGMSFVNVSAGYTPQWVARLNPVPGINIENMRIRWLGRGISNIVPLSQRSAWGVRLFRADGATLAHVDCRHLGNGRGYCGAACEAPWNANVHSVTGYSGHCIDLKQTDTAIIDSATVIDGPDDGNMKIDVSRNVTISNSFFAENVRALVLNNQTSGCGGSGYCGPSSTCIGGTNPGTFCYQATCNVTVRDNDFDTSNATDFTVQFATDPSWSTCSHIATLDGNVRTDGSPIRVEPFPLPATVTVVSGTPTTTVSPTTVTTTTRPTTTSTTVTTTSSTSSTTTSTTTSSTTTSSTTTTSTTTTSTTTTLPQCPFPCVP